MLIYSLMALSKKLRDLRAERDLTQGDVAKAIDVHVTHVSSWETSRSKPSLDNLIALSKLFGVSLDYIVFENIPREGFEAINDFELYQEFRETEKLSPEDKKLIRDVIRSVLFKLKVQEMVHTEEQKHPEPAAKTETSPSLRRVAGKR